MQPGFGRWWLVAAMALAVVVVAIGRESFRHLLIQSPYTDAEATLLMAEFSSIPVQDGELMIGAPRSVVQQDAVVVSAHVRTPLSHKEVLAYYTSALPELGWELSGGASPADAQRLLFCKEGMSLLVDTSRIRSNRFYRLGISRLTADEDAPDCAN